MIYLECNPDKALISFLGIPNKEIKHANGKGNICNQLAKSQNVKGMIDEDPSSPQPSYMKRLMLHSHEHNVRMLYDKNANNYMIVLCPTLEEWILKAVKQAGVDPGAFGLPTEAKELHQMINTKLDNFKRLLKGLERKSMMLTSLEKLVRL
jgi:hypothetical protein